MAGAPFFGFAPTRQLPGQLEGIIPLLQGLGQFQQQRLLQQDLQGLATNQGQQQQFQQQQQNGLPFAAPQLDTLGQSGVGNPGATGIPQGLGLGVASQPLPFMPKSRAMQQMMAQQQMAARAPMNPYQQATLGIQQGEVDARSQAARVAAEKAARGTARVVDFFDATGRKQSKLVDNLTFAPTVEDMKGRGFTQDDPLDIKSREDVIAQRRAVAARGEAVEQRDIAKDQRDVKDFELKLSQQTIDEYRKQQDEFRAQRADLRAEDAADMPKGQMLGDEWHEWRNDGKKWNLIPTGLKSEPRLQLVDIGENKGVFNPASGDVRVTEHPSAKVPSTQINIKQPPAKMMDDLKSLSDMQSQVVAMASIFDEDETFWSGKFENFKATYGIADIPGLKHLVEKPKERGIMFRQMAETLKEDLARKRSGGQITASEFVRLDRLVPDWKSPPDTFKAKLKGFAMALDRTVEANLSLLRKTGFIVPGETQVQGPQSVSAGRQVPMPKMSVLLDALNAATKELPGATKQEIAVRAREIFDKK